MNTRCPYCHTAFCAQPEQLEVRTERVRCMRCKKVFNSLDNLIDDKGNSQPEQIKEMLSLSVSNPEDLRCFLDDEHAQNATSAINGAEDRASVHGTNNSLPPNQKIAGLMPRMAKDIQDLAAQLRLLQPKDAPSTPSNSQWVKNYTLLVQRPFLIFIATLLALVFAGQLVFYYRGEVALNAPGLRPLLEAASQLFGKEMPLPRHPEWVSIEASDLQKDPAYGDLLVLHATLRNKATYDQAFPILELSLTNTQELVIARRIFHPEEYLSQKFQQGQVFKGNSDTTVRLWIDAHGIEAVGYRLYAFYL